MREQSKEIVAELFEQFKKAFDALCVSDDPEQSLLAMTNELMGLHDCMFSAWRAATQSLSDKEKLWVCDRLVYMTQRHVSKLIEAELFRIRIALREPS